jgi:LysM repeat protein
LAPFPGNGLPPLITGEYINGVPIKVAKPGETIASIATESYVKDRHIRKWNDLPEGAEIAPGEVVYLKPKRRSGSEEKHIVAKGENMRSISQNYGIKLKQLYKKNHIDAGQEPKEGEVLYMQKKRDSEDKVQTVTATKLNDKNEGDFVNPHSLPKSTDITKLEPIKAIDVPKPDFHVVQKGDNIYRIAEKYRVFEEDLLKWNPKLNPSTMSLGQKIYLSKKGAEASGIVLQPNEPKKTVIPPKTDKEIEAIAKEITVDGPVYHHVVKGDTLYNICKRYNITAEQLSKWNKTPNIQIQLGQKLQVSE